MKSKLKINVTEWLIYVAVFLIPLVFLPHVQSVFATPKLYLFRIITLLIVLIWGFRWLISKRMNFRWSNFMWFVFGYLGISIVNTIMTVNFWSSLFGTYGRFIGLLTFMNLFLWIYIVIAEMNSKEKILRLLWCFVLSAGLVAIYGILQHQDLWVNIYTWSQDPAERVFSTIGHSNHVAAFLGMALMMVVGLFVITKKGWRKLVLLGLSFLYIVTMIMTASRGGIIAIVIAFIFWFIYAHRFKKFKKYSKKFGKIFLAIIAVLFLASVVFRGPLSKLPLVERTVSTVQFMQEGNVPDRVSWWLSTFEMVQDRPFLGHGLSVYRDIYNQYRRADYKLPGDAQDHITPESAHMDYLNIWALQGTFGLLIYLFMIGSVFYYASKYLKQTKDKEDQVIMSALLAGIVVYLVQVLLNFGVITTLFTFYTLIGAVIAYTLNSQSERLVSLNIVWRILMMLFVLAFVVVGGYHSFMQVSADYNLKQAARMAANGNMEDAILYYQDAIEDMPYMSEYYEKYGDFLFELGIRMPLQAQSSILHDALRSYVQAVQLNPYVPYIRVNTGLVSSRLADIEEEGTQKKDLYDTLVLQEFQAAADISRNNPVYHYHYGKQLLYFGKEELAYRQFYKVLKIRDPYRNTQELFDQIDTEALDIMVIEGELELELTGELEEQE